MARAKSRTGQPRVIGHGVGTMPGLRFVRDPNTGETLFSAGGGRLRLPGSKDELRAWKGRLWLFNGDDPVCELAMPVSMGGDGDGSLAIADDETADQPVAWNGVRWAPTKKLQLSVAAIAELMTYELRIGQAATLTEKGIEFDKRRFLSWEQLDKVRRIDMDKPHGLPLQVDDSGRLKCDVPFDAPNLREFAWRSEVTRLREQVERMTPEVEAPTGGSIAFDVRPDGRLAIIVRKAGRVYAGTLELTEN